MSLLADRLIETSHDKRWLGPFREDFIHVAGKIRSAQRFVVSEDVRGAIRTLLTSKPSTLVAATKWARLPFDRCWFEWAAPDRETLFPGQIKVARCGAFMERYGPHGYTIFTAWEYDREALFLDLERGGLGQYSDAMPPFGVSSIVGAYDFSSMTDAPIMLSDGAARWIQNRSFTIEELQAQRDDERNAVRHALRDPVELEAFMTLQRRSAFRVHTEVRGDAKISNQASFTGDLSSTVRDVQDEMGHLFATLILMNAKNCVEIAKTEPPEKLNKARRKAGKSELLPYSTVHIELTQGQKRAVDQGRISREDARRHLVRGHFKVRATGVFWWNDSWRGNALKGVVERRAHVIEQG